MTNDQTRTINLPLTPAEAVPNSVLRDLAHSDPLRAMGQISDEHQAILSMYLPDICGELIAARAELATLRNPARAA
ncbi:hypothetical protein [Leisingera sp. ANG-M7]|uniref:hypothetical protein n=1 Tax=Leisingera sp. ANG-M7 TaxID=1577902 RepID=UPI00057F9D98|nr:hypothetical protein [Leisingera sp. ANG-M7]KIC36525.1 hypothetical protein RA26_12370 [Leisingera sp. ANG-M7]